MGVYNNDDDIQEAANYSVTVQWSRSSPVCPWNCNKNGNCTANGICKCNPGACPFLVLSLWQALGWSLGALLSEMGGRRRR